MPRHAKVTQRISHTKPHPCQPWYNANYMSDIPISCQDCAQEFVFTEGEQRFYQEKSLEVPRYCLICRGKYKAKAKQAEELKARISSKKRS